LNKSYVKSRAEGLTEEKAHEKMLVKAKSLYDRWMASMELSEGASSFGVGEGTGEDFGRPYRSQLGRESFSQSLSRTMARVSSFSPETIGDEEEAEMQRALTLLTADRYAADQIVYTLRHGFALYPFAQESSEIFRKFWEKAAEDSVGDKKSELLLFLLESFNELNHALGSRYQFTPKPAAVLGAGEPEGESEDEPSGVSPVAGASMADLPKRAAPVWSEPELFKLASTVVAEIESMDADEPLKVWLEAKRTNTPKGMVAKMKDILKEGEEYGSDIELKKALFARLKSLRESDAARGSAVGED